MGKSYGGTEKNAVYMYEADGNLVRMRGSSFAYDALGRMVQNTAAQGDTVEYQYDQSGDLKALVYPK